ncbi:MAG TPA: primosomal protein N' [Thermoanaerobaculia bacterium]|nr:primosomal protein N' [Thermoanaerobaculia bacterium]
MTSYAEIAVPLPLAAPLTYEIPPGLALLAQPGVRAKVRVGKRRLTGLVLAIHDRRPEGFEIRPIEEIVDLEPVVPVDLLELARFTADYYLAPIGEVVRAMVPGDLPSQGNRRVWATDAGAFATPRNPDEERLLEALRELGRASVADLVERLGASSEPPLERPVGRLIADLQERGWIASEDRTARGGRYVSAFELAPGPKEAHLAACGRSAPGKAAIEYLAAIGRPATGAEISALAEASPAVLKRLTDLGIVRKFTQVERLGLDRHMFGAGETASFELRPDQAETVATLQTAIDGGSFAPFLLVGMTGAGKTEVYLRAAEAALAAGKSAILLVPEIALVPALARAVEQRFGADLAILHSGLGSSERHQEWERVRRGEARVVLGPRSALFAPVANLGLIVVDEEQDPAYKQESAPRYHGRDLALVRARAAGAVALLVSATPSLESRYNAEQGKLTPLKLTARAGQGSLPEGILVDLRTEAPRRVPGEIHFSERLKTEIAETLERGEQIILLRNRRGYSPMLLCRACGEDFRCDDCGLPRTLHMRDRELVCHYCGSMRPMPALCPICGEAALEPIGAGTERVEEMFAEMYPGIELAVLDRDTARRPGGPAALLERFSRGDSQVLIGTQMVSKGHHFPNVSLTAVLAADSYLGFPDFRAVERTYNLLVQLAGRAGRGDRPGKVIYQTYHPEHYAIQAALHGDDEGFVREELRFRRAFHYPPFSRLVQILVEDKNRDRCHDRLAEFSNRVSAHPKARSIRMTGPAPAPFERLRGEWRFQLLLRSASLRDLHAILHDVLGQVSFAGDLIVDVDPQQLL